MSFDVHKVTLHKKKIILVAGIVVLIAILGVAFYEVFKNTASADTNTVTYKYTGVLRTYTGHQVPNKVVSHGTVWLARYYTSTTCTGTSTTAVNLSVVTASNGSFTMTGLRKGCYTVNVDGTVMNAAGTNSINVTSYFNMAIPAVSKATAKNYATALRMYRINGTITPGAPVLALVSPSPTPSVAPKPSATATPSDLYIISGTLVDSSGNPLSYAQIINVAPQNNYLINLNTTPECDPTRQSSTVTPSSAVTDANGSFTMNTGLPDGCYNLQVILASEQPGTLTTDASKSLDSSASAKGLFGKIVGVVVHGVQVIFKPGSDGTNVQNGSVVKKSTLPIAGGILGIVKELNNTDHTTIGPAVNALVTAFDKDGAILEPAAGIATGADGSFTFRAPLGANKVHVAPLDANGCQGKDYAATTTAAVPVAQISFTLDCTGPGSVGGISGKVLRKDAIPAGGVHLYIKNAITNLQDPQDIVANSDGTFSIGPVPAGSFVVGVDVNTPANQGVLTVPVPTGPTAPNCQSWTSKKLTVVGGKSTPITPDINLNCDN